MKNHNEEGKSDLKKMNKDDLVQYINSQSEDSITTVYFTGEDANGEEII